MGPAALRRRLGAATAALALALGLVQGLAPTGAEAGTGESLAAAKREAAQLRTELAALRERSAAAIARLEEAEHAVGVAVGHAARLADDLDAARSQAGGTDRQLQRRVSALYRSGGSIGLWASLLDARSPADLAARKVNVDKVVAADARVRDLAQSDASELAVLEEQARAATAEQVRATSALEAENAEVHDLLAQQQAALDRVSQRVRDLVAQEQREAAAAAAARLAAQQSGSSRVVPGVAGSGDDFAGPPGVCPVGSVHSFTDTWHAPRSGGRQHQGTDVFAPYGSPAYAVVDGVIDKWGNGGLGGITLWLRGDDGTRYYYAHNAQNVAPVGTRVKAGQLIAYVGNTGNARTTPPHVHFEAHPGGGEARNPAPWLKALCG